MLIDDLKHQTETLWINPRRKSVVEGLETCELGWQDVLDAAARWDRFADYFQASFPETKQTGGILESPLQKIPKMKGVLEKEHGRAIEGDLYIKLDSHLPISGSIKARGGVYEVMKFAEKVALEQGGLSEKDSYAALAEDRFRTLFSRYSVAVGSTGNLGLSIGIISAKLGFRVTVHMSSDAKAWKKDLLRSKGVRVIEYESDYSEAVARGRREALGDPFCHFVDDENSRDLFLGYSVAALRLKKQLEEKGIEVTPDCPLTVYLPCGVGGGPGGVAFGLKCVFGDAVRCYFAEPTNACCMILGMATGKHNAVSVQEIGLSGKTDADGLAVGRASGFVGKLMEPFLDGCFTVSDERMYALLARLAETEGIFLEPSALAGMQGPIACPAPKGATHVVWATGGSMVPREVMAEYLKKGK